jgi:hypothetical protein
VVVVMLVAIVVVLDPVELVSLSVALVAVTVVLDRVVEVRVIVDVADVTVSVAVPVAVILVLVAIKVVPASAQHRIEAAKESSGSQTFRSGAI